MRRRPPTAPRPAPPATPRTTPPPPGRRGRRPGWTTSPGWPPPRRSPPAPAALPAEVRRRFLPRAVSVSAPPGTGADLTPLLADRALVDGKPTAYVCQHFACQRPVTDPAALSTQLDDALRP